MFLVALQERTIKSNIAIHNIIVEFFKSYEKGVDICKTVSAAIEINGSGPPRKPNPNPSPNAPPRTDTTKILSTNNSIRIILGFKNI